MKALFRRLAVKRATKAIPFFLQRKPHSVGATKRSLFLQRKSHRSKRLSREALFGGAFASQIPPPSSRAERGVRAVRRVARGAAVHAQGRVPRQPRPAPPAALQALQRQVRHDAHRARARVLRRSTAPARLRIQNKPHESPRPRSPHRGLFGSCKPPKAFSSDSSDSSDSSSSSYSREERTATNNTTTNP